jgi:ribosome-associated translation inhibitor RaiA
MKINLAYHGLNALATWPPRVEEQLKHVENLTAIISAEVSLEHQRETKPPFLVQVRLEVPGPGEHTDATRHVREVSAQLRGPALHAEARDNTAEAALLKVIRDLEHQIKAHQLRHLEQEKTRLQLSGVSNRWTAA